MNNLTKFAATTATALTSGATVAHTGGFAATHEVEHILWLAIPAAAVAVSVYAVRASRK